MELPLYGASASELQEQVIRLSHEKRDLEDYAERVTRELRRYQQTRPAPPQRSEDGMPLPPWAANMQMMSPLLFAYEERIAELETVVERSVSLAEQAQVLTKENDALRAELRERTGQLRNHQLMAPMHEVRRDGMGGDEPDDLAELYRLSVEQNEALAQQNQLLKLQLERMQQGLVAAQRQARESQARGAEGSRAVAAEQDRVARAFGEEHERLTRALQEELGRTEVLARQRAAAEQRLEEVTGQLVEEVRAREHLQAQADGLQQELHLQGQSLELYKKSLNDRDAMAKEEEERLQVDLARTSQSERDLRHRTASLERELSEATDQLLVARREGDGTKQEAEQMLQLMESMDRRLRDAKGSSERAQQALAEKEGVVAELELQKDKSAAAEQASKRHLERLESRLQGEVDSLKHQRDHDVEALQCSNRRLLAELEDRLRKSEQATAELQTKAEVSEKQRGWEAAALERQSSLHAVEKERLHGDIEELQQARLRVERQSDAARQETARLRAELTAASAEVREGATRAGGELAACRARCQTLERSLGQSKEEAQACEARGSGAGAECARLQAELREERGKAAGLVEAERQRALGERRGLERQMQATQARARQFEQRAAELLHAQEALRQRWQSELGLEKEALETQIDRLSRENRALREKSRNFLKALALRRGGGLLAAGDGLLGLAGGHSS